MDLKKFGLTLVTTLVLISLQITTVFAASPHFVNATAALVDTGPVLNVSFKLAGLARSTGVTVFATSYATAEFACLNADGSLADTLQVSGTDGRFGLFGTDKNGQVSGLLPIAPPSPPSLWCNGIFVNIENEIVLVSISYTDTQLSEESAGTVDIPGTYSTTFYTLP